MKNAALVLDQKTFSFTRKVNLNFTQSVVYKRVAVKLEARFCPLYSIRSPEEVDSSPDSAIPVYFVEAKEIIWNHLFILK